MSRERNPSRSSSSPLNSSVDPSLSMWLWLIRFLTSDRDLPFSALADIIGNIPYTLDDFPSCISEGLALRCLEERAGLACGETPPAVATRATSKLASAGKTDAQVAAASDHGLANTSFYGDDLLQFIRLKREKMLKNSESSQPNVSYSKERNNLPEVSRPCLKHFTYNSHRDDHDIGKFIPNMKHASPQRKYLNLVRKYRELKNLGNTHFKSVGGSSQNDFNILQNSAKKNSLNDMQNQKTPVDGTCIEFHMENTEKIHEELSAEFHEGNLSGLAFPIIASDNIKESQSGQDSKNHYVLHHDRHELQADNDIQNVNASNRRLTVENNQKITQNGQQQLNASDDIICTKVLPCKEAIDCCTYIEAPETPINLNGENGREHGSNWVAGDQQPVNDLGITDYYCLSSHASHERNDDVCVNNVTCEVSKNHLQAEERKNLLTSDADNDLISLKLNENSALNIEGGCDHSANRKALSSKISVRFAKRNRREKADRDDKENKRTDRSSLKELRKRKNWQTQWSAIKIPSRRPKLIWKPEEEEVLEKAMQKIPQNEDGSTSWIKILEYCRPVLHESRTPIDLKDKWRNMQIREAKNRGKNPLVFS